VKAKHLYPALLVFGTTDDDVHVVLATGLSVSVEWPGSISAIQKLSPETLPPLVKAAVALSQGLSPGIFPAEVTPKLVNVAPGNSDIILITIGRKPQAAKKVGTSTNL